MSRDLSRVFNNQSDKKLRYSLALIDRMRNTLSFDNETLSYITRNESTLQSNLNKSYSINLGTYRVSERKKTEFDRLIDKHQLISSELNRENLVLAIKTFLKIQNIKINDFILIQFKKWMNFDFELKKQKKCERCNGSIDHDVSSCIHCSYVWSLNNITDESLKSININLHNKLSIISSENTINKYQKLLLETNDLIDDSFSILIDLGKSKNELDFKKELILIKDQSIYTNSCWLLVIGLLGLINTYLFSNIYLLLPTISIFIFILIMNFKRTTKGMFIRPNIKDVLKEESSVLNIEISTKNNMVKDLKNQNQKYLKKISHKEKLILKLKMELN